MPEAVGSVPSESVLGMGREAGERERETRDGRLCFFD